MDLEQPAPAPKRPRGRPPGVRNPPKTVAEAVARQDARNAARLTPPSAESLADYRHADPDAIVSRQLSMLDWAQQAVRNEMMSAMQGKGLHFSFGDVQKLEKLSNAIVRAIEALKKTSDLAGELAARMTPEQLLEAAINKIEGQDIATLNYAIRRLRAHRERLAPPNAPNLHQMGEFRTARAKPVKAAEPAPAAAKTQTAADAIASLLES